MELGEGMLGGGVGVRVLRVWAGTFLAGERLVELGLELVAALQQVAQDGPSRSPARCGGIAGEFGAAGVGGLVDPVRGEAAGEDVDGGVLAGER